MWVSIIHNSAWYKEVSRYCPLLITLSVRPSSYSALFSSFICICTEILLQGFPGGQCLRICLPIRETLVQSLAWEDSTCHGATRPVHHNYWAHALEPSSCNYWAYALQLLKPAHSRAHALQQEKPPQWEVCAPQLERKPTHNNRDQVQPKINKNKI